MQTIEITFTFKCIFINNLLLNLSSKMFKICFHFRLYADISLWCWTLKTAWESICKEFSWNLFFIKQFYNGNSTCRLEFTGCRVREISLLCWRCWCPDIVIVSRYCIVPNDVRNFNSWLFRHPHTKIGQEKIKFAVTICKDIICYILLT